jgi:hypothetical protein
MKKSFEGRKENLIGKQTNHHDHDHNADHLFHRLLLASEMQKLAESEAWVGNVVPGVDDSERRQRKALS